MKRLIEEEINDWLSNDKEALLLEGARQVGKTYIVRKILNENNINFFEINFIDRPDILKALQSINEVEDLIKKIELYSPTPLIKGESVIFLDEIQMFPEIITKIKFLVDEGSYKYILSGSLLGVEIKGIKSVPVGYMRIIRMYPMNFVEFLIALGVKNETINYLEESFTKREKVDDLVHGKILRLFNMYLVVGGMPQVINKFLETRNLYEVDKEEQNIVNTYKADFSRYESEDRKLRIISIYDNIPSQLNKQNLRFVFTYLNKELKFDRYENSFLWLKEAGVAYPVYIVNEVKTPLIISKDKNTFKLFLSDVGLLSSTFPFSVREDLLNNEVDKYNNGAIFENFVAQELNSNEIVPYYYKSTSIGEIDFLIEFENKIMLIEVKSGNDYKKHKALDNFLKAFPENAIDPIVLSKENVFIEKNITYLPIYMVAFLKKKKSNLGPISIDIKGL